MTRRHPAAVLCLAASLAATASPAASPAWAAPLIAASAAPPDAPPREATPSESATRRQIDALIAAAPGRRATLGLIQRAIDLSIAFGAPTWNNGDHDACARFYVNTGQSLCAAFEARAAASDPARLILKDLRAALDRAAKSTDVDANAWTMRYVFDKTSIAVGLQTGRSSAMVDLGQQSSARSAFPDTADAYADATAALHELDGLPTEQIPIAARFAPFALGDALFAQRRYAESAAAVADGLKYIPDLAAQAGDLRKRFPDPAMYRLLADDLRAAADKKPDDAGLQFLYGYHLFFTGQRPAAKDYLERALKLDPKLSAADKLLNPPATSEPPTERPNKPPTERRPPRNGDL